ncbi:redox-regulated ATPase YchF [bacterium]|nr:redox-regulated ATPase YchF [bacterium]
MALKCGIVGLPNVGKSTLFNALSENAKAESANYPFCTIDPNIGIVEVPDERLGHITAFVKPKSVVPTHIEFVDIAGLVKGASKGEGLGNQFLSHIRDCDAIVQVVRCFEEGDVIHVNGSVDPIRDIEVIETELMLADLSVVEKRLDKYQKLVKSGSNKAAVAAAEVLTRLKTALDAGTPTRDVELSEDDLEAIKDVQLITRLPVLYVGNIDEASAGSGVENDNPLFASVKKYATERGNDAVAICAKVESELAELPKEDRASFLEDLGLKHSGLQRLVTAAYGLLGLITYFTAGEQEVRAWTIRKGWKAPKAAGVIHGDFERGFIAAETYAYADLMKHESVSKIKEAGLMRKEGKEYVVKDGDVMLFRFNV